MIDYETANLPIQDDEPIRVQFQRKVHGEYKTYFNVEGHTVDKTKKILIDLCGGIEK